MEFRTIETAAFLAANGKVDQDPALLATCKEVLPPSPLL